MHGSKIYLAASLAFALAFTLGFLGAPVPPVPSTALSVLGGFSFGSLPLFSFLASAKTCLGCRGLWRKIQDGSSNKESTHVTKEEFDISYITHTL